MAAEGASVPARRASSLCLRARATATFESSAEQKILIGGFDSRNRRSYFASNREPRPFARAIIHTTDDFAKLADIVIGEIVLLARVVKVRRLSVVDRQNLRSDAEPRFSRHGLLRSLFVRHRARYARRPRARRLRPGSPRSAPLSLTPASALPARRPSSPAPPPPLATSATSCPPRRSPSRSRHSSMV